MTSNAQTALSPRPIKLAVLDETAQAELYRRVKQRQAEQDAAWKRARKGRLARVMDSIRGRAA